MVKLKTWFRDGIDPEDNLSVAIFDLFGVIYFSGPDKPFSSGRRIKEDELVFGYPGIEEYLNKLKTQGWVIIGVGRNIDPEFWNVLPEKEWLDIVLIGNGEDIAEEINQLNLREESFYCKAFDPVIPEDTLTSITVDGVYRGWEIFDKWPIGDGPSVRDSGTDLIVFVGASGSGRDEGLEYLKTLGYTEIRRATDMTKVIQRIRNGVTPTVKTKKPSKPSKRYVFNATNPKVKDRREVLELYPEARVWWFARPGREFAGGRVPEAAFTKYSREFEIPTVESDKVPILRLT